MPEICSRRPASEFRRLGKPAPNGLEIQTLSCDALIMEDAGIGGGLLYHSAIRAFFRAEMIPAVAIFVSLGRQSRANRSLAVLLMTVGESRSSHAA